MIQLVEYFANGGSDVVGNPVFQAHLVASGEVWVLTAGMLIKGTWTKPTSGDVTLYVDAAGAPIKLTPGRTWVELCPIGGATILG